MKSINTFLLSLIVGIAISQSAIISGPMLGPVELRDAVIWLEVAPTVKSVALEYHKKGDQKFKAKIYRGELGNEFNPLQIQIGGLDFNTTYEYQFIVDGKPSKAKGSFTTKDLWQWRKPAPDFTFLVGSCHYGNQPIYDRPGKPYGGDSSIFISMANEANKEGVQKPGFMLWTGDEWYTREVDYFSKWGLWYRAQFARAMPVLQPFLKSMPQWAMWDDHDYGPNDIGTNYILKEESRKVFMSYFSNPSYGFNNQGIYTMNSWSDVDLFMLDDRWWRSADGMLDSIEGKPNPDKLILGAEQMRWLKNSLVYSGATFKVIVLGSQVLNPVSSYDNMRDFPVEYQELLDFLEIQKIEGVVFLTGDRHHSEILKVNRQGSYPLYDITISPLTSGTHVFSGNEKNNPYRVAGVDQKQNYGRIFVSGPQNNRAMKIDMVGLSGELLDTYTIYKNELKYKK